MDNDGDEMNGFIIKEMGMIPFLARIHPSQGILSEANLCVSDWVKPTQEAIIHLNQFLYYYEEDTSPCEDSLPSQDEIDAFAEKLCA